MSTVGIFGKMELWSGKLSCSVILCISSMDLFSLVPPSTSREATICVCHAYQDSKGIGANICLRLCVCACSCTHARAEAGVAYMWQLGGPLVIALTARLTSRHLVILHSTQKKMCYVEYSPH